MNRQLLNFATCLGLYSLLACENRAVSDEVSTGTHGIEPAKSTAADVKNESAASIESGCRQICQVVRDKSCNVTAAACEAACVEMAEGPLCTAEMKSALHCMTELSASAWACGDTGFPELLPGHCESEQELVVRCMANGASSSP